MNLKSIKCYLKAIPCFLRTGEYVTHCYVEKERFVHDIFVTDIGFRISSSMEHSDDEEYIKEAILIGWECKRCGKAIMTWQRQPILPVMEDK